MASIGHIAVGMAAARVERRGHVLASMLLWAALSLLPDIDVIGFRFGIRYAAAWGHRGATHSFAFALAVAVVLGLLARALGGSALRTSLLAAVVVGSHAVLDTFTDGGLGCALWWPFDAQRYFAPWRPIPVAPLGLRFFSRAGLGIALTEVIQFSPFILYALWPRRSR